jgi:hypothetical protein
LFSKAPFYFWIYWEEGNILKYSKLKRMAYGVGPDYACRIDIRTGDKEDEKINLKQVPRDAKPLKERGREFICPVCAGSAEYRYSVFTYRE